MRFGPLNFLLTSESGEPFRRTEAWLYPAAGARFNPKDWTLALNPQEVKGDKGLLIQDLKRTLLFSNKESSFRQYGTTKDGSTLMIEVERVRVVQDYLKSIKDSLPEKCQTGRFNILIPALDDPERRNRYIDAITGVFPHARVLPEPEMVVEYFRLARRTLTLDPDRNNIVLVIDVGASTANLSVITSNRSGDLVGGQTKRQRARRLRAIQGSSNSIAGRWVDETIAKSLEIDLPPEKQMDKRIAILTKIEKAKVKVSSTGRPAQVLGAIVTHAVLKDIALEVITELIPVMDTIKERLWQQLTGTATAKELSRVDRESRKVSGPENVLNLLDYVILAGGTSRLPGFKESLGELFDGHTPNYLEVGAAFPVAAAIGALVHILHDKHSPPKLRTAQYTSREPRLEGALSEDILLGWKPKKTGGHKERTGLLLKRGDPIIYEGGRRSDVLSLELPKNETIRARIRLEDTRDSRSRTAFQHLESTSMSASIGLDIDSDRGLRLHSDSLKHIGSLYLNLDKYDPGKKRKNVPRDEEGIPEGFIALDESDEIVMDFGMSKTVVLTNTTGLLDVEGHLETGFIDGSPTEIRHLSKEDNKTARQLRSQGAMSPNSEVLHADKVPKKSSSHSTLDQESTRTPSTNSKRSVESTPQTSTKLHSLEVNKVHSLEVNKDERISSSDHFNRLPSSHSDKQKLPTQTQNPSSKRVSSAPINKVAPTTQKTKSVPAQHRKHWDPRTFAQDLKKSHSRMRDSGYTISLPNLATLLLASAVRPLVLLAGPPGCGKSSLVRLGAQLIGAGSSNLRTCRFHEIPVQAHWTSDEHLFRENGPLACLQSSEVDHHVILFDEFNLARPEYYLSRLFSALERGQWATGTPLPSCSVFGTLNVDDTSRPPSPKIVDRSFLMEVIPPKPTLLPPWPRKELTIPNLGLPPEDLTGMEPSERAVELVRPIIDSIHETVEKHYLRYDLIPSNRVGQDIRAFLGLHNRLKLDKEGILSTEEAVDRLLIGRVMVKLSGAEEQVWPVIEALQSLMADNRSLKGCRARLKLANTQRRLGFISPWQ